MSIHAAYESIRRLQREVATVVVGKEEVIRRIAEAIAAGGHILLEDFPGVAKTATAKAFARSLGLEFSRIQFTPDLLPSDITGSFYFNLQANRFELRRGPIFTNILLADEINRAPPKTQSALLEAMQERQATLEGETHPLPKPFIVIGTQNPIEIEGTYPLPEAQLDRFMVRLSLGYPSLEAEAEVLRRHDNREDPTASVAQAVTREDLAIVQSAIGEVRLDDHNRDYIVRLVQATRADARLVMGASPRGSLALSRLARARAIAEGRDFVIPDDVKVFAIPALAHRVVLTAESRMRGVRPETVVGDIVASTPTPVAVEAPDAAGSSARVSGVPSAR